MYSQHELYTVLYRVYISLVSLVQVNTTQFFSQPHVTSSGNPTWSELSLISLLTKSDFMNFISPTLAFFPLKQTFRHLFFLTGFRSITVDLNPAHILPLKKTIREAAFYWAFYFLLLYYFTVTYILIPFNVWWYKIAGNLPTVLRHRDIWCRRFSPIQWAAKFEFIVVGSFLYIHCVVR